MTPKIVKRNRDRMRAATHQSTTKAGMFRSGDKRKVRGGR